MPRRNKRPKKRKINKQKIDIKEEKKYKKIGQFPLNKIYADRVSFSIEINDTNEVVVINNVSYEMFHEQKWVWIVRYDDHAGSNDFHMHIRYSLEDESDLPVPSAEIPQESKEKLFDWAIVEIKDKYLIFRSDFCKRNGLDLY